MSSLWIPRMILQKCRKLISLRCLWEIIPNHVLGGTKFHICLPLRDTTRDWIIFLLMCLVCLLLDCLPLFSNFMALWLSLFITLSQISYQYSFKKHWVHITWFRTFSNMTSLASVQFLVFNFFARFHIVPYVYHGHKIISVPSHILVQFKYCINIQLYMIIFFYWKYQW